MCASHDACRTWGSALDLKLATLVIMAFAVFFCFFQCPQGPRLLVDPWLLEIDRSVHLHDNLYMTSHAGPSTPFFGLKKGMPVLVHVHYRTSAFSHIRGISSSVPSSTAASGKSEVNLGFTTGSDSCVFSKSPN